jgi:O-antigen/teichoic acid export membrane protein
MSRTGRTVAWNTAVQAASRATSLVLSLAVTMLLTRHLGVAGYGSFVAVFVYMTFFASFADWGTQTILIRDLAQEPDFEHQVGVALALRLGLAVSASLLAAATVPLFYRGQPQVLAGVLVALPTLLFGSIATTVTAAFQARLRMGRVALVEVTAQAVSIGAVALLVVTGRPLREVIAGTVAASGIQAALLVVLARKVFAIRPRIDLALSRQLLRRALPLGVSLLVTTIYFKVDALILSTLSGPREIGMYGLSYRVCEAIIGFPAVFVASMFPLLAAAARSSDATELRRLTQRAFDVLVLGAVPAVLGVVAVAPMLVRFIAGSSFGSAVPVLRVLVVGAGLMFVNGLFGHVLIALDKQRTLLRLSSGALLFNVVANLLAIPRLGALGAAAAATASEILLLVGALWTVRRYAGITPSLRLGRRSLVAGLAMTAAVSVAGGELFASIAVGVASYGVALWAVRVHRSPELRGLVPARLGAKS